MKRLHRSKKDRVVSGVCGGVGEYFDIDSNIVRIIFILLLIVTGVFPFGIAYILAALILPEK